MVKGRNVLCINTFYPVKDSNKKNSRFRKAALLDFLLLQKFRSQTTKDSFPSAYANVLFTIFLGI